MNRESNSLLIPLKFGNVITNSQLLSPNDKYTQMIILCWLIDLIMAIKTTTSQ